MNNLNLLISSLEILEQDSSQKQNEVPKLQENIASQEEVKVIDSRLNTQLKDKLKTLILDKDIPKDLNFDNITHRKDVLTSLEKLTPEQKKTENYIDLKKFIEEMNTNQENSAKKKDVENNNNVQNLNNLKQDVVSNQVTETPEMIIQKDLVEAVNTITLNTGFTSKITKLPLEGNRYSLNKANIDIFDIKGGLVWNADIEYSYYMWLSSVKQITWSDKYEITKVEPITVDKNGLAILGARAKLKVVEKTPKVNPDVPVTPVAPVNPNTPETPITENDNNESAATDTFDEIKNKVSEAPKGQVITKLNSLLTVLTANPKSRIPWKAKRWTPNEDSLWIQKSINMVNGADTLDVDGVFGNKSFYAVKDFQTSQNLKKIDGKAGQETVKALIKELTVLTTNNEAIKVKPKVKAPKKKETPPENSNLINGKVTYFGNNNNDSE